MTGSARDGGPPVPAPARGASRAVAGFVVRFVAGWLLVLAVVAMAPSLEHRAVATTIASLGMVSNLCRVPFDSGGTSVEIAHVGMQIVPDCTPLMPFAAFAIAVVAFPAPWLWRLGGLAAGAILLWAYNLARIFALVPVLRHRPQWFEFIHVYLWQTVTLLVVFGLFIVWLGLQNRHASRTRGGGAPAGPSSP